MLVGVATTGASAGVADLLEVAMRGAIADAAGRRGMVAAIGEIAIPRGSWADVNPAHTAAERVGIVAPVVIADVGVPQQTLISRILARVAQGEIEAGLIVGVEARRWLAARGTASGVVGRSVSDDGTEPPETRLQPHGEIVNAAEIAAQVWEPVQQYALIDSALARADGLSNAAWETEIDDLWARWNAVAVANPESAFATLRDAAALRSAELGNRLLAHPYRRFHSTQWNLDQATALLICAAGTARRLGIAADRWIFPHVSLESSHALPLSNRRELHRWPAMHVLGEAAGTYLGVPVSELDHIDLYSCFPAAVRVQQRELGLDPAGTHTITGGMPFAGGPFNHSTLWSTAAMARRLREHGGRGLVTNVSGLLTKPGLAVWGSDPAGIPRIADLGTLAGERTAAVAAVVDYRGMAIVRAATVVATDDGREVIVVAETPTGERCVARGAPELVAAAFDGELIGETVPVNVAVLGGPAAAWSKLRSVRGRHRRTGR